MLRIELRAAADAKPGHGELTVRGWKKSHQGEFELSVQRNQDDYYLGEFSDWVASAVWHLLGEPDHKKEDNALVAHVGPWLVDPITQNQNMAYKFQLRNSHGADFGVLRIMGTLLSSQAADKPAIEEEKTASRFVAEPEEAPFDPNPWRAESALDVEPEPEPFDPNPFIVEPEPNAFEANPFVAEEKPKLFATPEPELLGPGPEPPKAKISPPSSTITHSHTPVGKARKKGHVQESKKSSKLPLIIGILLVLGLIGAAVWWFFLRSKTDSPDFYTGAPARVEVASSCSGQALADTSDDLGFIRTCLNTQPTSQQVLATIDNAKQAKRCNLVQRLYAYKAQAGDVTVALAYAAEYDPHHFSGGCIEAADVETAVYWYEMVLEHDPQNAQARQRLQELKP